MQPWERASRRPALPSVHVAVMDQQDRHRDRQPTTKLDIERHNVTPEALRMAGSPDRRRTRPHPSYRQLGHVKDHLKPIRHWATLEVSDHDVDAEPFPEITTGGVNVIGYEARTAVNDGSELLIFVPRAAHGRDLSSQFVAGRQAALVAKLRRVNDHATNDACSRD